MDNMYQHVLSFPTRRSSDLGVLRRPGDRRDGGPRRVRAGGRGRRDLPAAAQGVSARDPGGFSGAVRQDRKSTRLNSSHGYISYAVFCLKKKRKILKIILYTQ